MNLIDAIKSGRPFRRGPTEMPRSAWHMVDDNEIKSVEIGKIIITVADVLADDWEIQEPKVEITRAQFWEAASATLREVSNTALHEACLDGFNELARRLGLEGK